jgi:diadenosine tetraphosphate (Ap4A) HIT family hydrolase
VEPAFAEQYHRTAREGPCFVCEIVAGRKPHHLLYEDEAAIAFLNRYPTLNGYTLVAPREHRERVVDDFSLDEYLALQAVVHRVGQAVARAVATERLYVLSLGSMQGNRHVHWHLAPLPPGVAYDAQQLAAIDWERAGLLEPTDQHQAELAARIRRLLSR